LNIWLYCWIYCCIACFFWLLVFL